jgi:aquaporin Z
MIRHLKNNLRVYLMEAICLGLFMISASLFSTLLEYPGSPVHNWMADDFLRLCVMGVAMGITIVLLIYSPMGKLSGAHMNPAMTLTFFLLGKVNKRDLFFYMLFQFIGGLAGVILMDLALGNAFESPPINYVTTIPGKSGEVIAFWTEVSISFFMILMVLISSNYSKLAPYTGYIAGIFVTAYVIISAPVSGFSMNPARTLASAIPSHIYTDLWIYFSAPVLGMLSGALIYKTFSGEVKCAKIHHSHRFLCIFNCKYCGH